MAAIRPLACALVDLYYFPYFDQYRLAIVVLGVEQYYFKAVDDLPVGLTEEDAHDTPLAAVEIVEGWLNG